MSGETQPSETVWLGQPALTLDTPLVRFITVPGMGAKIVSLFDKRANREWLLPPVNRGFEPAAYGTSFVDQDMSGWDEMFPTIDACPYPVDGNYKANPLPDHGEVWAIPWQVENVTNESIVLSTVGHALPYRLTRTAQMVNDQRVRLAFEVINTASEPIIALWAAHPQFVVDEATRIVLPSSIERVVVVYTADDGMVVGQSYPWAEARSNTGGLLHLDRIGAADLHTCRKFYPLPDQPVNWAALQQGVDGDWIRLSWDAKDVPYLGVWVDEGTFNAAPTAALEPSTGFYDDLAFAWRNNRVMHLPPNTPVRWHLDIEIGTGTLK